MKIVIWILIANLYSGPTDAHQLQRTRLYEGLEHKETCVELARRHTKEDLTLKKKDLVVYECQPLLIIIDKKAVCQIDSSYFFCMSDEEQQQWNEQVLETY